MTGDANETLDDYITVNSDAETLAAKDIEFYQEENSLAAIDTNDTPEIYKNQNIVDTSNSNSVLSELDTQNSAAADSLSGNLSNYVAQNQDAVTLVSSEIDGFMPLNTTFANNYSDSLAGADGFISQGNSATDCISSDFRDYILVGNGATSLANSLNEIYIVDNKNSYGIAEAALHGAANTNTEAVDLANPRLQSLTGSNDTITFSTADNLTLAENVNVSLVAKANPALNALTDSNDAATSLTSDSLNSAVTLNTAAVDSTRACW